MGKTKDATVKRTEIISKIQEIAKIDDEEYPFINAAQDLVRGWCKKNDRPYENSRINISDAVDFIDWLIEIGGFEAKATMMLNSMRAELLKRRDVKGGSKSWQTG